MIKPIIFTISVIVVILIIMIKFNSDVSHLYKRLDEHVQTRNRVADTTFYFNGSGDRDTVINIRYR